MLSRTPPLQAHPAFRAANITQLCEVVERDLGAKCLELPRARTIEALANRYPLPSGELWFCSYGIPLRLWFPEGAYWRIQFQHNGSGGTLVGRRYVNVTEHQACISNAVATIDFGTGFEQVVWRMERTAAVRKLAALLGEPPRGELQLESVWRLDTAAATVAKSILGSMLTAIDSANPAAAGLILAELEQALIVSLLHLQSHNFRHLLDRKPPGAMPARLRRAEEYLDARLDQPLDLAALAEHCDMSVRSIYRLFHSYREMSPLKFLKQRRLVKARQLLEAAEPTLSVTQVALSCGFGDISHFSREFTRAFGRSPSSLLRPRR